MLIGLPLNVAGWTKKQLEDHLKKVIKYEGEDNILEELILF